jgi:uncharacterized protein YndB with AHSA1/START domain
LGTLPRVLRIEFTLEIERAATEVFAYLADVEKLPEWQSSALESRADGPMEEGARISERRRLLGRDRQTELEVTAFEPPRRLTLRSLSGPVRFTVDHELAEDGGGTLLRFTAEAEPGSFLKLAEPVLRRTAEQEFCKDFERLKEILERG